MILTRASCFRPVFEGCRIWNMCEFDKGFEFSGLFLKGAESTKCPSLARASCFRAVFGMPITANVAIAALKSTFFENSIVFQRPLGIQKVLHNACFERQHRVSGMFLNGKR